MKLDEIKALIAAMAASDLTDMTVSANGWSLRLARHAAAAAPHPTPALTPPPMPVDGPDATVESAADAGLRAPLAGVVHLQPAPDTPPFVRPGQAVKAGDILYLIEAMKVFNTVRAERDGIIVAVLVTSGCEVEAGQVMMQLE